MAIDFKIMVIKTIKNGPKSYIQAVRLKQTSTKANKNPSVYSWQVPRER